MTNDVVNVILIDDDQDDFFMLEDLLKDIRSTRYEIKWVPTFEAAIENLKEQAADVYLIDYRLGGRTGLDLIDLLRGEELRKPMILLTGYGNRMLDITAMEKGVSNFLCKDGITSELLERSIRYAIKQAEDQEKIRTGERLRVEREAAETASEAKSQFLSHISHEIRTPLGAIIGFAELALDDSVSDTEKIYFINTIKKCGNNLLELLNDVLDLSKIEAGKVDIYKENFRWQDVVNDVLELLSVNAKAKGLMLAFEFEQEIPRWIDSDCQRFRQILTNLVGNAIKFTKAGKITVRAHLGKDHSLVVSVHDTGIGISAEDQKKLFQPFSQCHTKSGKGTGLGLDLSRKLACMMGGNLALTSSIPNWGSIFTLVLPGLAKSAFFSSAEVYQEVWP